MREVAGSLTTPSAAAHTPMSSRTHGQLFFLNSLVASTPQVHLWSSPFFAFRLYSSSTSISPVSSYPLRTNIRLCVARSSSTPPSYLLPPNAACAAPSSLLQHHLLQQTTPCAITSMCVLQATPLEQAIHASRHTTNNPRRENSAASTTITWCSPGAPSISRPKSGVLLP